MNTSYGWTIDKDFAPDPKAKQGTNSNAATLCGPRALSDDVLARLKAGEGTRFRMYDDDGNLCYEGRFVGDSESEDAFAPLDNFGTPNVGCTRIDYLTSKGWEQL